jgi:hypothetical protein
MSDVLALFPKVRDPLPPQYQAIYDRHYQENRAGGSPASALAQRLERWMHHRIADDIGPAGRGGPTLEIGAGTLNHLPFEPETNPYDIVEPSVHFYDESPHRARVRRVYGDIAEVPIDARYERIISIATFEHVCDLPAMVARCARLLTPSGCLRAAIPSEGAWLWKLGWQMTTGVEFRLRYGLSYERLMRHEHVNTAREIRGVVEHFFSRVQVRFCGISSGASFYQCLVCTAPRLDLPMSTGD